MANVFEGSNLDESTQEEIIEFVTAVINPNQIFEGSESFVEKQSEAVCIYQSLAFEEVRPILERYLNKVKALKITES